jgi:hypothetical protein
LGRLFLWLYPAGAIKRKELVTAELEEKKNAPAAEGRFL